MSAYTGRWGKNGRSLLPVADFGRPEGVVQARIDGFTGGQTGRWTRIATREWFIRGTEPGSRGAVDEAGLLYDRRCGGWLVDLTNVGELAPDPIHPRVHEPRGDPRGWRDGAIRWWLPCEADRQARPSEEPQELGETRPPTRASNPDEED